MTLTIHGQEKYVPSQENPKALEWFQDNYFPRGNTGRTTGRPEKRDWYKYLDFMDGQLQELLTGYGKIAGIWFDGMWDKN